MKAKDVIEAYLQKHDIPKTKFAKDIGVSYQFLWLVLKDDRDIGPDTALAIEKATNGEIKKEWLVFPEEYRTEIEEYLNKQPAGAVR
jgi:DNA-binding transcriptional regulator YdaS (Cro superfamily)